ncbi:GAF domain-containing protein [Thermochromatium tepidum]|uniref:GAF domain-containing protein n=1 Tax=Thermochromatium tepidum ATCC 43061 TaxID=316276 RepID=A0A6I6E754_THETI|nr:GAF domain-containing protein [Thermochromatium tepidum]QGU32483.1 GAF domain-containing protein [Thermochromatium tepidum ATCC 43061]
MSESLAPGFWAECEREQLHHVQSIQPWGCLLGGRTGEAIVRFASANLADWTNWTPDSALGRALTDLLPGFPPKTELADIAEAPDAWMRASSRKHFYPGLLAGPVGTLDGLLSCNEHNWLLELEVALPANQHNEAYRPVPHRLYRMPYSERDWENHCQYLADEMRAATGFERVMIYRFRDDGCGEVISESLTEGLLPYLGLRYPASDIPQIARHLYRLNSHRQIPDIHTTDVPILSLDPGALADLSLSDLRAVSPVHLEYLRNMGVTASLSFSVPIAGELWGLIACHHSEPRHLPLPVRLRCAEMAQVFALAIAGYQSAQRLMELNESDQEILALRSALWLSEGERDLGVEIKDGQTHPIDQTLGQTLLSLERATGAALVDDLAIVTFGQTPEPSDIRALVDWLRETMPDPIFATDRLSSLFPDALQYAEQASGLLVVRIEGDRETGDRWFLWWRPEQPQTVQWAGDPRKGALFDEQRQVLSPRSSFERWIETTARQSEPWTEADRLRAKKFRSLVLHEINAHLLGR